MEDLVLNNLTTILQGIYAITKEMADNYANVDSNSAILNDLSADIIKMIDGANENGGLNPESAKLKQLYGELKQAKLFLEYYMNIEQKYKDGKRSHIQKAGHAVKKFFYYAPEYDKKFKQCNEALDSLLKVVIDSKKDQIDIAAPIASGYKEELKKISPDLDNFWGKLSGEKTVCNWAIFVSRYKKVYSTKGWTSDDWERLKHAIGAVNGNKVDITGLMELAKETSFPIKKEKLPSILDSEMAMDVAARIEIGKMIKSMIRLFNSEKMENHMYKVQHWYSNNKHLEKINAANELYESYVAIRMKNKPYDELSKEEQMIYDVEKARRDFSYFYQEFMVIVKFGSVSRSVIHSINFPGERNINQFVEYFKPLDRAYNSIVVGRENLATTNDDCMKVYTFLNDFLNGDSVSKELEEMTFIKNKLVVLKKAEMEFEKKKIRLEEERAEFKDRIETIEKQKKKLDKLESDFNQKQLKISDDEKVLKEKQEELKEKQEELKEKQEKLKEKQEDLKEKKEEFERKVKNASSPDNFKDNIKDIKKKFFGDSTNKNSKSEDKSKETRRKSEVNTEQVITEQVNTEQVNTEQVITEQVNTKQVNTEQVHNEPGYTVEKLDELELDSDEDSGLVSNDRIVENHFSSPLPISVN